jgi:hypothetical protein
MNGNEVFMIEALSWKFNGGTEENHVNLSKDRQHPSQDSN